MNTILSLIFAIFIFALPLSLMAADGSAPGGRFNVRQKAEKKEASRWTLKDWLEQKDRNQMMDLWLGMYAPSPYEFFIGGAHQGYLASTSPKTTDDKSYQSFSGQIGAYATVVGIEGTHEHNTDEGYSDVAGSVNLRVLGNAVQGTHLIFSYGLRNRSFEQNGVSILLRNQFAGADLDLYLTRYFGIQGNYKYYFSYDDGTVGSVTGSRLEAGAFIDFESVRIFGNYFSDLQDQSKNGVKSTLERTGIQTGLLFFF